MRESVLDLLLELLIETAVHGGSDSEPEAIRDRVREMQAGGPPYRPRYTNRGDLYARWAG